MSRVETRLRRKASSESDLATAVCETEDTAYPAPGKRVPEPKQG